MASILKVDAVQTTAGKPIVNSTGSVLQVKQSVFLGTFTTASTSFTNIVDGSSNIFQVLITPTAATSKILVIVNCSIAGGDAGSGITLVRDSTEIFRGATDGSKNRFSQTGIYGIDESQYSQGANCIVFLDDPDSTSELTYKVQAKIRATTLYIGRTVFDTDNDNASRHPSSITVMEIAE